MVISDHPTQVRVRLPQSGNTQLTDRQWELINSEGGYSIKLADKQFLGFDGQKVVIQSTDSTKWSINPASDLANNTYQ